MLVIHCAYAAFSGFSRNFKEGREKSYVGSNASWNSASVVGVRVERGIMPLSGDSPRKNVIPFLFYQNAQKFTFSPAPLKSYYYYYYYYYY